MSDDSKKQEPKENTVKTIVFVCNSDADADEPKEISNDLDVQVVAVTPDVMAAMVARRC